MRKLKRAIRKQKVRESTRNRKSIKSVALTAGTAALAIALQAAQRKALASGPDPHQQPLTCDADGDLIKDANELAIGYKPFRADQNKNQILDGVELAIQCAQDINNLSEYDPNGGEQAPDLYIKHCPCWGQETCDICGEWVNMCGLVVVNPKLNLEVSLPYLALHYMEHGTFSYAGSVNNGRCDIPLLLRTLERRFPNDPNEHQLPLDFPDPCNPEQNLALDANDYDNDLLSDTEELNAGYNLYNPDQDEDLTPDGIELARQCVAAIDALPIYDPFSGELEPNEPYKEFWFMHGLELCEICGQVVNMGYWRIVIPDVDLSMVVYDITCHYMSHGSFSWWGDFNPAGRIDVPLMVKILGIPTKCGDLGTIYLPGDYNRDCRQDFDDLAEFTDNWLKTTNP